MSIYTVVMFPKLPGNAADWFTDEGDLGIITNFKPSHLNKYWYVEFNAAGEWVLRLEKEFIILGNL